MLKDFQHDVADVRKVISELKNLESEVVSMPPATP